MTTPNCPSSPSIAGRRLYIHDFSFRVLAVDPTLGPDDVAQGLMRAKAMRVSAHHIESAVAVGAFDQVAADQMLNWLRDWLYQPITELLRLTSLWSSRDSEKGGQRLLRHGEKVVASCFDDGYWTFATTNEAARRMYSDQEPLRALYLGCRIGAGPRDLVMVRGPRLAVGPSGPASRHVRAGLDSTEWRNGCDTALRAIGEQLLEALSAALTRFSVRDPQLVGNICGTLDRLAANPPAIAIQ